MKTGGGGWPLKSMTIGAQYLRFFGDDRGISIGDREVIVREGIVGNRRRSEDVNFWTISS